MIYFTTWGSTGGGCGHLHHRLESAVSCLRAHRACRRAGTDRAVRLVTSRRKIHRYGGSATGATVLLIRGLPRER